MSLGGIISLSEWRAAQVDDHKVMDKVIQKCHMTG